MRVEEKASAADVLAARDRYVPRGISATDLVVARAWGARIWDADGREYLDFAGGIACQNLGHGPAGVVRAVHEQVDRYLHQCFMVGVYEPYVEVCRRLDDLWPGDAATKSILVNSGAEAIENAVKIARTATGRPGVVVFDRAFHGRTTLTMAMTSKLVYKQGFGPLAPAVYRAPAPYPYRGVTTDDALAGLDLLFKQDVDPGGLGGTFGGNPVACAAAAAVLDELAAPGFRERAEQIATLLRRRLDEIAARRPVVGEVRGLGAMLALELTERSPAAAKRIVTRAREGGLVLLSCGLDGNVIRLLPPLSATDDELDGGLTILEEALGDAGPA